MHGLPQGQSAISGYKVTGLCDESPATPRKVIHKLFNTATSYLHGL